MTVIVGPELPEPYAERIESVWADLQAEFDVGPQVNPHPHVTLYGLEDDVGLEQVEEAVRSVAAEHDPVPVNTDGVGVFPGNHVWLPVARSPELAALHRDAVAALAPLGEAPTPFYEPHRWFPHVGLALRLDAELAGDIVTYLLDRDFEWSFTFDSISVTRLPADATQHEVVTTVDL